MAHDLDTSWASWKERFLLSDGRVVDPEQGGISHSEGQAYALLIAQAVGDRETFDLVEEWTRANLLVRDDALMAWRWTPSRGIVGDDWHNATDGDLFRAWALLRAARDSGWPIPRDRYEVVAAELSSSCLWPDPRVGSELVLRPSAEALATEARVLLNPSYVMPRAMRELGVATGDTRLVRAAEHGATCLAELAASDLAPDWIDLTAEGYADPTGHDLRSAYDALRIPLYLVWSGDRAHPAVALATRRLAPVGQPPRVVVARDRAGDVVETSDLPGYLALSRFLTCDPDAPTEPDMSPGPYYPAVLHILTKLAAREGAACGSPQ